MTEEEWGKLQVGDVLLWNSSRAEYSVAAVGPDGPIMLAWPSRSGGANGGYLCSVGTAAYVSLVRRASTGSVAFDTVLAAKQDSPIEPKAKEISHWNTTCSGCGGRGNMGFLFFDCEAKCSRPGDTNAR